MSIQHRALKRIVRNTNPESVAILAARRAAQQSSASAAVAARLSMGSDLRRKDFGQAKPVRLVG